MSDREYNVGYGKPPKHSQFKKGQSGNPKGRPKGSKNFSTHVRETLDLPVPIQEGGKTVQISTQKAALMRLREKALKGDQRALDRLLGLAQVYSRDELDLTALEQLPETDQAILDRYLARKGGGENE